jgi:hypothetical protein
VRILGHVWQEACSLSFPGIPSVIQLVTKTRCLRSSSECMQASRHQVRISLVFHIQMYDPIYSTVLGVVFSFWTERSRNCQPLCLVGLCVACNVCLSFCDLKCVGHDSWWSNTLRFVVSCEVGL